MPSTKVFHMTAPELKKKKADIGLDQILQYSRAIKDIKKCHSFEVQATNVQRKVVEKISSFKIYSVVN